MSCWLGRVKTKEAGLVGQKLVPDSLTELGGPSRPVVGMDWDGLGWAGLGLGERWSIWKVGMRAAEVNKAG